MKNLERAFGQKILSSEPVNGGNIAVSQKIMTNSGPYFCKLSRSPTSAFREEAAGLEALRELGKIRVPKVHYFDDHYLVLEWIETQEPEGDFWKVFGAQLAALHSCPQDEFGFQTDNHIGTTTQANPRRSYKEISWVEYFMDYRLKPMINHQTLSVETLLQAEFQKADPKIREALSVVKEAPALLHGDLWGGNFVCDTNNKPVLVDPAPYRGHREVDLAMTELFGGYCPDFYQSYKKTKSLKPGYENRRAIYNLYHLLNHWIMFGSASYRDQTLDLLRGI